MSSVRRAARVFTAYVIFYAVYTMVCVYIFSADPSERFDVIATVLANIFVFLPFFVFTAWQLRRGRWVSVAICVAGLGFMGSLVALTLIFLHKTPFDIPWPIRVFVALYGSYALFTLIVLVRVDETEEVASLRNRE